MARPTNRDASVIEACVAEVADEIIEWKGSTHRSEETELEEVKEDLRKLFKYGVRDNGYKMTRKLDDMGWDCDSELVEILDGAWVSENRALTKVIKEWVEQEGIKPAHSIGDWVVYKHHKYGEIQVEITKINEEVATYRLTCEGIGHIKEGSGGQGTLGFIVPFEEVDTEEERVGTTPLFKK